MDEGDEMIPTCEKHNLKMRQSKDKGESPDGTFHYSYSCPECNRKRYFISKGVSNFLEDALGTTKDYPMIINAVGALAVYALVIFFIIPVQISFLIDKLLRKKRQ